MNIDLPIEFMLMSTDAHPMVFLNGNFTKKYDIDTGKLKWKVPFDSTKDNCQIVMGECCWIYENGTWIKRDW